MESVELEGMVGEAIYCGGWHDTKLRYLEQLRLLSEQKHVFGLTVSVLDRIDKICDSIENDLYSVDAVDDPELITLSNAKKYVIGAKTLEQAEQIAEQAGLKRSEWTRAHCGKPAHLKDGLWVEDPELLLGEFTDAERFYLTCMNQNDEILKKLFFLISPRLKNKKIFSQDRRGESNFTRTKNFENWRGDENLGEI